MLRVILLSAALALVACSPSASEEFTAAPESFTVDRVTLEGEDLPRTVALVDTSFFANTPPLLGRRFAASDYSDGTTTPVALISHAFWSARFSSQPDVIGQSLQVNGEPHVVVGIMPEGVDVPAGVSIWLPRRS